MHSVVFLFHCVKKVNVSCIVVLFLRWPNGRNQSAENVDDYISDLFKPIFVNASLQRLTKAATLAGAIKGGGRMDSHQVQYLSITSVFNEVEHCFYVRNYTDLGGGVPTLQNAKLFVALFTWDFILLAEGSILDLSDEIWE
jgi:hypothetical protein